MTMIVGESDLTDTHETFRRSHWSHVGNSEEELDKLNRELVSGVDGDDKTAEIFLL